VTSTFWDSSALVSLCVRQQASRFARQLSNQHRFVVWWCTPVEMQSAFERLARMGQLSPSGYSMAVRHLAKMRTGWQEVHPTPSLRSQAESLLALYPLKAADALQLSAALTWAGGFPKGRTFIASDGQLLDAARKVGFQAIDA
jgi:predicted nucleic acid-binding protein